MMGLTKILPNNVVITDERREIPDRLGLEAELRKRGLPLRLLDLIDVTPTKMIEHSPQEEDDYADNAKHQNAQDQEGRLTAVSPLQFWMV